MLAQAPDHTRDNTRAAIITLVTDGYSVWVTVFRGDPLTLAALVNKYPGTRG